MGKFQYSWAWLLLAVFLFVPVCWVVNMLVVPFLPQEPSGQYVVGSGFVICFTAPIAFLLSYWLAWLLGYLFHRKESLEKPKR